jgi:hypothetical protein
MIYTGNKVLCFDLRQLSSDFTAKCILLPNYRLLYERPASYLCALLFCLCSYVFIVHFVTFCILDSSSTCNRMLESLAMIDSFWFSRYIS